MNEELIKEAYEGLKLHIFNKTNTSKLRKEVKALLEIKLEDLKAEIICDESNNTPQHIDERKIEAIIFWKEGFKTKYKVLIW